MSLGSFSAPHQVLGTTALVLFFAITLLSQITKSKDSLTTCLLALLSLTPILIVVFVVEINVPRPASINLGAELPRPVVESNRTDAPTTIVRNLLRACGSLAIPSRRILRVIFIPVYDRTLQRFYLFKHAIDKLVSFYLATSAETRTAIAAVHNRLWEMAEVVTTLLRPTSPLEPALVADRLLTLVEVAIHQPDDLLSPPSLSFASEEYAHAGTPSTETPSTSQAPSPTNTIVTTSPPDTNGSAALPYTLPSIVLTPSHQAPSEVIFDATKDCVDEKTKYSAVPSNPSETHHSGMTVAAPVSGNAPQTRRPRISSVPFPSHPILPEDDQTTPANVDSLPSKANFNVLECIAPSAPASGTVPRAHASLAGQVKRDVDAGSVPFRRSRKIAQQGLNIVDPAEWRGKPLEEVAAAIARGRATATIPRFIDEATSTSSLSSYDGTPFSTISHSPVLTQSTPATSVEVLYNHPWETGAPASIPSCPFEYPNDSQALDAEASVRRAPEWEMEDMVGGPWDGVLVQELYITNRERQRQLRRNARERKAEKAWKWAKAEGKKPVGWRTRLAVSKPAPAPTTFIASQAVDGEWNDPGLFDEDTQKAILMSMGIILEDFEVDHEASANHQHVDSRVVGLPISTPPTWVPADFEGSVDEGSLLMGDSEKALQKPMREVQMPGLTNGNNHRVGDNGFVRTNSDRAIAGSKQDVTGRPSHGARMGDGRSRVPMLATATLVSTGGEEDDLDEGRLSEIQRQQAITASKIAMTMPFYGASTSCAFRALSDEEWARLEQFEATPWSLVETVLPQTAMSMDVDVEVVQSWVPPPPPPPPPAPAAAPAKIKEASRTKNDEEWARLEQFEAMPSSLVEAVRPQSVLSMAIDTEVVQSWVPPPPPPPPPPPAPAAAPAKIKEASRTKKVIKKILKRVKTTFQLKNRNRTTGVF